MRDRWDDWCVGAPLRGCTTTARDNKERDVISEPWGMQECGSGNTAASLSVDCTSDEV